MRAERWGFAVLLAAMIAANAAPGAALLTFVEQQRDGVGGVDGLEGARGVIVSPDGASVYAIGILENTIASFARSSTTGGLTFLQVLRDGVGGIDGLDHPVQLTISPDGRSVYVASSNDDAIDVFQRDTSTGLLTLVQSLTGVATSHGSANGAGTVFVSPDGKNVYVGADGPPLITYARSATDGFLTELDAESDGKVAFMAINPAGDRLYAIGPQTFVTYARDASGALDLLGAASPADAPSFITAAVAVAANGDIYVTADRNLKTPTLELLRPGASPGQLDTIQQLQGGPGGVGGLSQPRGIALSRDGKFVFVAGLGSAVGVFRRQSDGTLEFVEGQGMSLGGVFSLAVSPDSHYLYAAGAGSNNIVVFSLISQPDPREVPALSAVGVVLMLAAFATVLWWSRRTRVGRSGAWLM